FFLSFYSPLHHPDLHSFPTRRSSDLLIMKLCSSKVRGRNPNFLRTSSDRSKRMRSMSSLNLSSMYFSTCSRLTVAFLTGCFMGRSEEHTSELQSLAYLVCRLLLEKKK